MIACLYEGSAERAVLDILHENGFLVSQRKISLAGTSSGEPRGLYSVQGILGMTSANLLM